MIFEKLGVQAFTFREAYSAENASEKTLGAAFKRMKELGYDELQVSAA